LIKRPNVVFYHEDHEAGEGKEKNFMDYQ